MIKYSFVNNDYQRTWRLLSKFVSNEVAEKYRELLKYTLGSWAEVSNASAETRNSKCMIEFETTMLGSNFNDYSDAILA